MQRSGVSSGKVATILVVAGFFVTFTAGFSLFAEVKGIQAPRNFSGASNRSAAKRQGISVNRNSDYPCREIPCLPMCCPSGNRLLWSGQCIAFMESRTVKFPTLYDPLNLTSIPGQLSIEDFHIFIWNPCHGGAKFALEPGTYSYHEFKFLSNGSVYMTRLGRLLNNNSFCFAAIADHEIYDVMLCLDSSEEYSQVILTGAAKILLIVGTMLSVSFLLLTFLIYSIIPELRNMHGRTLRGYVSSLIFFYIALGYGQFSSVCILFAYIMQFSLSSSFFWLNVISFDMWRTFRGFRSIQGTEKEQEKKKFIMYSIYAWGSGSLLTGVCAIMDFVPSMPKVLRPEFGRPLCWFNNDVADTLYMEAPVGITLMCNVYLFISTTRKMYRHKKDTAHYLKEMDSQRHENNKQWFILYLKLFIVMGMIWQTEFIYDIFGGSSPYITYIFGVATSFQGMAIFTIFICKHKTKTLLLKHLGCQNKFPIQKFNANRLPRFGLDNRG